jgi:hypothetical protein
MDPETRHRKTGPGGGWVVLGLVVLLGLVGAAIPPLRTRSVGRAVRTLPDTGFPAGGGDLEKDPRVLALREAYGALIDTVRFTDDDAVFVVGGQPIYFQDGRLLGENRLRYAHRFDPFFYEYSLGPLTEPPPLTGNPVRCTDLLDRLFGRTEPQIREHCRSLTFLGRSLFVNDFCRPALQEVEAEIRAAARTDEAVAAWMAGLKVAYSFMDKEIVGSASRSYHAWGLAVDLIPESYGRRQVYWKWSRVFNPQWHRIPIAKRWSPPQAVIEVFERHGFVWGGKWSHFDTIHFEYRPEILIYNRLLAEQAEPVYR